MSLIIFTDVDGILLPLGDRNLESIKTLIQELQQQKVTLVLVTNNTRAEVEQLSQVSFADPFIVEQGSGVFIPQGCPISASDKQIDEYHSYQLGCTYTEARAGLKVVQEEINKILRGFGDLDEKDIQDLTGCSLAVARRAKAREFTEYFLTPNRIEIEIIREVANEYGFEILKGEKLSLIMGQNAAVESAVEWLLEKYRAVDSKLVSVGIGTVVADLKNLDARVTLPSGDAEGIADLTTWIETVRRVCQEYL